MSGNNVPLISAIVSTYNSELFFEGKMLDLLSQTIIDKIEIIVVNSGSDQNEDQLVQKFLKQYSNIRYIKTEERESIYKAWNRGIKIAMGKYITNANTDDRLKPNAYEILSSYLEQNSDIAIVYADQYISSIPNETFEEIEFLYKKKLYVSPDFNYFHLLDRCLIFSQPMWRANIHTKDNIWFNENYEISGDYDFYLRTAELYKFYHLSVPLGVFYLSAKNENKSHKNIYEIVRERDEISTPYIKKYIQKNNYESTLQYRALKRHLFLPIPIYYILKKITLFIKPSLINSFYFHSIEFIYYFCIVYLEYHHNHNKSKAIFRKINRYSKSERILKLRDTYN